MAVMHGSTSGGNDARHLGPFRRRPVIEPSGEGRRVRGQRHDRSCRAIDRTTDNGKQTPHCGCALETMLVTIVPRSGVDIGHLDPFARQAFHPMVERRAFVVRSSMVDHVVHASTR